MDRPRSLLSAFLGGHDIPARGFALAGAVLGLACGVQPRPTASQDLALPPSSAPPQLSAPAAASPPPPVTGSAVASSSPVMASGSASAPAPQPGAAASSTAVGGKTVALPKEPWFLDKPEHYNDCSVPGDRPASHFPAPFETCDAREESWSSPPGSHHLHFHYRYFSVSVTTEKRKVTPGACCYAVWEFPSEHRGEGRP